MIVIHKKKKKSVKDYDYFHVIGSSKSVSVFGLNSKELIKKGFLIVIQVHLNIIFISFKIT